MWLSQPLPAYEAFHCVRALQSQESGEGQQKKRQPIEWSSIEYAYITSYVPVTWCGRTDETLMTDGRYSKQAVFAWQEVNQLLKASPKSERGMARAPQRTNGLEKRTSELMLKDDHKYHKNNGPIQYHPIKQLAGGRSWL